MILILERLVSQLRQQGKSEQDARVIATAALIKSGSLNPDGSVTPKGVKRGLMTAEERAIDRQAERSGRDPSEYEYIEKTNSVRLKKGGRQR